MLEKMAREQQERLAQREEILKVVQSLPGTQDRYNRMIRTAKDAHQQD